MAARITDSNGLAWEARIDDSSLQGTVKQIEKSVGNMSGVVAKEGDKMESTFKRAASAAAAYFTAQQGMQLVNSIIRVRGEFQQLEIAFTTMLQSKSKSDKLMSEMVELAAKTPFGLNDIAAGAKQLLAYGFAAEDISGNITRLGNIASGVGSQIGDLIYLYGTLKASGRVTQMDINQFAGRGIPIYSELAKVLGVSVDKVRELVSAGQVGFPQIEKAFQNLTSQGGMFYNLMEEQSKSLVGQIANLQDNIDMMFNEIGQSSEGLLSDGISGIAYLVENYKELGSILAVVATTYGTYRAALILTSAIEKARYLTTLQLGATEKAVTTWTALRTQATNVLSAAQARLNAVMAANPVGLIITAVAALGAAYYFLADKTTAAEKAQEKLTNSLGEVSKAADELKNKTQEISTILNDGTQPLSEQIAAYQRLQELYPGRLKNLSLEEFGLLSVSEKQRILNEEAGKYKSADIAKQYELAIQRAEGLKKMISVTIPISSALLWQKQRITKELEAETILAEKLKEEIRKQEEATKLAAMSESERLAYLNQQKDELSKQIKQHEDLNGELVRAADGTISIKDNLATWSILSTINQFNTLLGQINSINRAMGADGKPIRNLSTIDKEMDDIREKQKTASSNKSSFDFRTGTYTKGYVDYEKDLNKLMAERRAITGETDKTVSSTAKKTASTVTKSSNEQARAIKTVVDAEKQATTARMIEGEKQVAEIKARYEAMRQALRDAGVKAGDVAFGKIDALEEQATTDNQYERDTQDLKKYFDKQKELYQQYNDYKEKAGVEAANKEFEGKLQLDKSFNQIVSDSLRNHIAAQAGQQATAFAQARELMLREYDDANTQDDENRKRQALVEYASYQQKREAIMQTHNERIKALGETVTADQIAESERQKSIALGQLADEYAGRLTESKSFFTGLVLLSRKAIQAQIQNIKRLLQLSNLDPDTRKKLQYDLEETKKLLTVDPEDLELVQLKKQLQEVDKALQKINDGTPESVQRKSELMIQRTNLELEIAEKNISAIDKALNKIASAAPIIAALGEALSNIGGEGSGLSELGAGLSSFAGGLQNLITQVKDLNDPKNKPTSTNAYVAAAQFALQVISAISDAKKKRKQSEEEFYLNAIGLQNDYNLALLEQQRIQAELNENVFIKDYFGRAKSGMEAAIKAAAAYQSALDKLAEGRAKERQKNVVDGKTVGQLALSGAAAGAVIGAVAGVGVFSAVGAAVGAVIGGIVGAIGGLFAKKKKDVYGGLLEQYPELLKKGANGQREINKELAESLIKNNQLDAKTKQLVQTALDQEKALKAAKEQVTGIVGELAGSLGNDLRNALVDAWKTGEDSAKAFGNTVEKVLENILSNLLFHAAFDDLFDELQSSLSDDFVYGGINDVTKSLGEFFEEGQKRIPLFNAALDAANEIGKGFGFDLKGQASDKNKGTLSGAISAASQESIDLLAGHTMGMRVAQLKTNDLLVWGFTDGLAIANQSLDNLVKIEQNTYNTVNELKSLNNKIQSGSDIALAMGGVA